MAQQRAGVVTAILCAVAGLAGCIHVDLLGGPPEPLIESVVDGERGPKILLLEIDGVIDEVPPRRGPIGRSEDNLVSRVREQLDRAREDDEVRALLLRINSPGGTAAASDSIYSEILRFKREREIPVVAQLMGLATSGGYYVAMAADRVVAHPTTVTGSIGVLFVNVSVAGLMEKLGIYDQTLTAGRHKAAASPLRRMSPEERAQIQSVLEELHGRFRSVVDDGRPGLDAGQVEALADGRIYAAEQARERGLVDEVGDLHDAVAAAQQSAGLEQARVVSYHRPRESANNLYTGAPPARLALELPGLSQLPEAPGFYFLWAPSLQ